MKIADRMAAIVKAGHAAITNKKLSKASKTC